MYVQVKFTNGTGNQLFQYFFGYLLSRHHNAKFIHPELEVLKIPEKTDLLASTVKFDHVIERSETNFLQFFEEPKWNNLKFDPCYPEDYRIYLPYLEHFKELFPPPSDVIENDLIFHLRLGDRLLRESDYSEGMKLDLKQLAKAIECFDFERLHIVTDMPYLRPIDKKDLEQMVFHMMPEKECRIEPEVACAHFNEIVDFFAAFDPIVHAGNSVYDDFYLMRRFKKILFHHGTFSWWAAAIGNAEKVGVYGPWRPNAGRLNRNLGKTPLPGWFSWGEEKI